MGSTPSRRGMNERRLRWPLPRMRSNTNFNGHGSMRRRPTSAKSANREVAIKAWYWRACGQKYLEMRQRPGRFSRSFTGFASFISAWRLLGSPANSTTESLIRRTFTPPVFVCDRGRGGLGRGQGEEMPGGPPGAFKAKRRMDAREQLLPGCADRRMNGAPEVPGIDLFWSDHR